MPLACELTTTHLDEAPSYEAISYAWGDPNNKIEISCNEMPFWITVNLHEALKRFRHEDEPRILWADGLCIDQLNDVEKGHQVGFMTEIYRQSQCTLVWLGSAWDEEGVQLAFEMIDRFTSITDREYRLSGQPDAFEFLYSLSTTASLRDHHKEYYTRQNVDHLKRLFKKSWFSRIWVQQEVGISQRGLLYCGDSQIDLSKLVLFAFLNEFLFSTTYDVATGPISSALWRFYSSFADETVWLRESILLENLAIHMRQVHLKKSPEGRICSVLSFTRKFQATDARDHVIALLGHPAVKGLLEPDYTVSLNDMQLSLVRQIILKSSTSEILLHVENIEEDLESSFPSWIPQWHKSGPFPVAFYHPDFDCWWKRTETAQPPFSFQEGSLQVEGFLLDVVHTVCPAMQEEDWEPVKPSFLDNDMAPGHKSKPHLLEVALKLFSQSNRKNRKFALENFMWTLAAGVYIDRRRLYGDLFTFAQKVCSSELCEFYQGKFGHLFDKQSSAERFHAWMINTNYNRKLFSTKNGFIGNGSFLIQEGDVLALVRGCRMPLIVRPAGADQYKLVGPCYVGELDGGCADEALVEFDLHQAETITLV